MISFGTIYAENCLETMYRMPDELIDMTITSPPYDDLRDYKGYHCPVEEIAIGLFEKTKPGGVVIWVVGDRTINGDETLTSFKHAFAFRAAGFRVHDTMIYAKNNPIPSDCGKRYRQCFEYMFCFSKGQPKTFNPLTQPIKQEKAFKSFRITKVGRNDLAHDHIAPKERKANNIFFYNVGTSSSKDKIAFEHPAIFPEQLAADQIMTWTDEGDVVYDCFMGSGTTAKAAHLLKRNWIGSEISPEYVNLALERVLPINPIVILSERDGVSFDSIETDGKLTAVYGPKGGWTDEELELARNMDASVITFGGRILRAETAAIAITAILQNRFGDMN